MASPHSSSPEVPDLADEAATLWMATRGQGWTPRDQEALQGRLQTEPKFAAAYARAQSAWEAVGRHAATPELMAFREAAIARARSVSARRWTRPTVRSSRFKIALAAAVFLGLGAIWQFSPYGYDPGTYTTGLGEQKTLELSDHSHIVLNARTKLRVRFSADARNVELLEGQAQFSVAKDPARPFKVHAGAKTVVAVGTVFDVEYIDNEVAVAMMEGRVAVLSGAGGGNFSTSTPAGNDEPPPIELSTGEALQIHADGATALVPKADIEAATAWRQGKVIFRNQPLSEAVHRLNRYSRQQIVIDDALLAQMKVSGVFDSDDAQAFVEAMKAYLPVTADPSQKAVIHLRMK